MNRLIRHIIKNDLAYFLGCLVLLFWVVTRMAYPGFDSSFKSIGIQDDRYIENIAFVDSVFNKERHILLSVTPKNGSFLSIHEDMRCFEEHLSIEFEEVQLRSWLKALPYLYSTEALETLDRDVISDQIKNKELFSNFISEDLKSFLLLIDVPKEKSKNILHHFNAALDQTPFVLDYEFNSTSIYHLESSINQSARSDLSRILLLIFIFFVGVLWVAYRNLFSIFYLSFIVILSIVASIGLHSFLDVPYNLITNNILPVVIVLAAADAIHLLTGYSVEKESNATNEKMVAVYKKYFFPSLLTSLTTAVAFISLMFNSTLSVYHLGWITGLSVLTSFIICYAVSPFLFRIVQPKFRPNETFKKIADFLIKKRSSISFVLVPILLIAVVLLPQLKFKNNFEIFLPKHSVAKKEHDLIRNAFGSTASLDLIVRFEKEEGRKKTLKKLQQEIKELSIVKFIKSSATKSVFRTKYLVPFNFSKYLGYTKKFSAENGNLQRLLIGVNDPNGIGQIKDEVKMILENYHIKDYKFASSVLAFDNVNNEVGRSLMLSLISSTTFLFLVFYFLTKSTIQAAIGIFANLVPLSLIVIIFVLFDFHINILTAITAVVCLGIRVDDTIHCFFRRVVRKESLKELSFGIFVTTVILVLGFGILLISDLEPIQIFGGVAAVVFLVTLLSDLTLLLHLIDLYEKFISKNDNAL